MPYKLKKVGSGYKVAKKSGGKTFSKKPMTKKKAEAQMRAMYANESLNFMAILEQFVLSESGGLYAWMDKNANIIPVPQYESHVSYMMHKYGKNLDEAFSSGWFRLTYYGKTLYIHNTKMKPNQKQLKELKDSAIEEDIERIYWDNEDRDVLIWVNPNL